MIEVHVWDSAWLSYLPGGDGGSPGHAAIRVGDTYVSFWPGEEVGALKWKGHKTSTFETDKKTYADLGQTHWSQIIPGSNPGPGLNESMMLASWREIQQANPDYTAKYQCSAVVNELLISGGSRKFLVNKFSNFSTWVLFAVSPSDVQDYVQDLVNAIDNQ